MPNRHTLGTGELKSVRHEKDFLHTNSGQEQPVGSHATLVQLGDVVYRVPGLWGLNAYAIGSEHKLVFDSGRGFRLVRVLNGQEVQETPVAAAATPAAPVNNDRNSAVLRRIYDILWLVEYGDEEVGVGGPHYDPGNRESWDGDTLIEIAAAVDEVIARPREVIEVGER